MNQSSLERIDKLHPIVAAKARELVAKAESEGISFIITQTLRTMEEQAALYAQGRTTPGQIVTNAPAGSSYHNYGLALDYCLLDRQGNLNWNERDPKWIRLADIGKSLGFDWGGDWDGFKDYPHLEYTFGLSIADLKAGKRPPDAEGGFKYMSQDEAKFILAIMGDYWERMEGNEAVQKETHRVAGVLRKEVGLPEED